MKKYGIKPYRRRTKKYEKRHKDSVFPNLLLTETPQGPGHMWASDFTHIVKYRRRWVYLATILDLFNREIVGWSVLTNHSTQLVLNAWCLRYMQTRHRASFTLTKGVNTRPLTILVVYASQVPKSQYQLRGVFGRMASRRVSKASSRWSLVTLCDIRHWVS